MLPDINALEQFPRQIARGRRTEEISDRPSNHTRYPENHGSHLDALIPGNHHLVVYVFDRFGSVNERRRPSGPERTSGQDRITGTLQITRMFERKSCIIKCSVT